MAKKMHRIHFENILYSTDFSQASNIALPYAVALAEHYGARIYAVHAISPEALVYFPPESVRLAVEAAEVSAKECMERLTSSAIFGDVPHESLVKQGEVWDVLRAVVSEYKIDLIAVGTRGRRGINKLIMGSVAEEVSRLAPCPVLTVGPHGSDTPPQHQFRRILFATDFSADSVRAMDYAISLAEEFEASLTVMHVAVSPQIDPNVKTRMTDFFTECLCELIPAEVVPWCTLDYVVEFGIPADAILNRCIDKKTDLIVMGTRGAGSMIRASTHFGGTVHRVVTEAHCPVLTIRGLSQTNSTVRRRVDAY
jgi:nucleotide-binding universal stress UspA family protein